MREHLLWMEQSYRFCIEAMDGSHLYFQDIGSLGLPVRVIHALQRYDICQVRELVILSQYSDGICGMRHLGETSEEQIENALQRGGLLPKHYEKIFEKPSCINVDRELAAFQNLNIWFLREHEQKDSASAELGSDNNCADEETEKDADSEQEGDEDDGNSDSQ
ncbi:MAG: hypothetical protein LUG55_01030 [Clostridiales bacterium]|nr:hypothetical protein [Clostridiales bacterium]